MKPRKVVLVLLTVLGAAGAVLSVGMLISAIRFLEWGRVILYCVTLAVSVELALLNILKLKPGETDE